MSISKVIIAVLILFTSIMTTALAQLPASRPFFKTLNVADGLPQSFVSALVQDSMGFIWIGTRDGLARYDGRKFKIFRHVPTDTTTLSDNIISNLYLSREGQLWIYFEAGDIDVLNTLTESLFHFTKDPVFKTVYASLKIGTPFTEDTKGNIWMFTVNGGLFVCNIAKHSLQFFSESTLGLQDNKIATIIENMGHITLVTEKGLIIVNENMKFSQTIPYTFLNPFLDGVYTTWKLFPSVLRKNGDVVIIDDKRLIVYQQASQSFITIPVPRRTTEFNFNITKNDKGQVFFEYNFGLYVLSPDNKLSLLKTKKENPVFGFKSMLVDRSGVLWLGGNGTGIRLYDLRLSRLSGQPYKKNFHEDILQNFLHVPEQEIKNTSLYNMQPYLFRWIGGNSNDLWLSKAGSSIDSKPEVYHYKNGHLFFPGWHYTDTSNSNRKSINCMSLSSSGKFWGIDFFLQPVYFDSVIHTVTIYPQIAVANFNYNYTANSLLIDKEDLFWISTAMNGLFCYNKKTGATVHYTYGIAQGSLSTNQLMNLVQDPSEPDILWIGSLGGGLIRFNKTTGKCHAYTTNDGLPNNTVYSIVIDSRGILWCSSNKGIFSFNPKTAAIRSFTSKDGLPGDEFNRYHFLQFPDGRIAFGGVDGYVVFDPLSIADDNFPPPVALTGIRINNIPADFGYPHSPFNRPINSLQEIVLPYNQNFVNFEFAALEYNITEKLQYRYMLEGFDEKWVNAGNENMASYTKISPGHYTLKINATNTAGKWSSHIKILSVVILPPFWQTAWFTALWILALIAVIYFIIQYRIKEVRKEEQQKAVFEREASELKAQALRAQMNPHFIFNCLNSIKSLIHENNKQQAVNYLTTFSKLIRNQLNNAQLNVSLYDELQTCILYTQLESLRFGSKIICEFMIPEAVDTRSLQVPPLILQPFIENAIWHGILPKGGGLVTVSVTEQHDCIQCTIEDDGIGRDKSMGGKSEINSMHVSKGMKLVQGRLNLHNIINSRGGTIELIDKKDENDNPSGTLIKLTFKKEA